MKTIKGPALFLAQFAGDTHPFNSWDSITKWAADCGYSGVQVPSWDARLIDVASKAVVARRDFVGKEPPKTTSLDWNWGLEPADEAVAWAISQMR